MMTSKKFDQILKRYLEGTAGKEERELVEQWFEKIEAKVADDLTDEQILRLRESLWTRVNRSSSFKSSERVLRLGRIAASVFFLIATSLLILNERINKVNSAYLADNLEELLKFENKDKVDQVVCLSDGSKVVLSPGGELHYPSTFGNERRVYLKGIAFFDVVKDAAHPFVVHTRDVVTKVLGTSFLIEENNKTVEVSVKTGKVMVYTENQRKGITSDLAQGFILKPNQKVVYDEASETLTKKLVEVPTIVNHSVPLRFKYDDAPVADIFNALENSYGIRFEFNREDLASCTLTTELSDENLYERIEIICHALGLEYTIGSDTVEIKGKCK